MSFQEYWQCRRRESFGKSRVITETVGFILFLACGLIRLKYPNFPIDQTIWWAMACVFFAALLIDICFVSPYRHAQLLEHEHRDEVQKLKDELRALRKQIDYLLAQKNSPQPILLAIDELRGLYNAGRSLATAFQLPEVANPTFEDCSQWNDRVTECVRRQIFSEVVRPSDVAQFIEPWDSDECYDAEANLDTYGLLDNVDSVGRVTHRYIFGRVRRLEELLDKIDGKPESRTRLKAHYSANRQECLVPVEHRDDPNVPGSRGAMARLRITSKSEPDIQGCKASLVTMYENCKPVVTGHKLPLRFDPANDPGSEEKNIKFGVPEFLEFLEFPNEVDAELRIAFPYAYENRNKLDPSKIYAFDLALTADNSPALRITLDVFKHDDSWQLQIRR